jgi:hypothetical protein
LYLAHSLGRDPQVHVKIPGRCESGVTTCATKAGARSLPALVECCHVPSTRKVP